MFKKSVADFRSASGESKLTIESGKLFHNLMVAEKKLNLWMSILENGAYQENTSSGTTLWGIASNEKELNKFTGTYFQQLDWRQIQQVSYKVQHLIELYHEILSKSLKA